MSQPDNDELEDPAASFRVRLGRVLFTKLDPLTASLGLLVGALVLVVIVLAFFIVSLQSTNSQAIAAAQTMHDETIAEVHRSNNELLAQIRDARTDMMNLRSDVNSFRAEMTQRLEIQDIKRDTRYLEMHDIRADRTLSDDSGTNVVSLK